MVKALARAWRWKRQIESSKLRSLNDIAEAEKLNSSYVSRIFRLTLLAPDIVEAILASRAPCIWRCCAGTCRWSGRSSGIGFMPLASLMWRTDANGTGSQW